MEHALREPGVQRQVAMMMIFGADDSRTRADVLRIKKQVERYHPEPKSSTDKPSDLAGLGVPNTRLAGGELLSQLDPVAVDRIAGFIQLHVADEDHPWIQRRDRIQ